jgi:hypothetical protein
VERRAVAAALHGLGIDHHHRGDRLTIVEHADDRREALHGPRPDAVRAPASPLGPDRRRGPVALGQGAPLAAGPPDEEERVDHLVPGHLGRRAAATGRAGADPRAVRASTAATAAGVSRSCTSAARSPSRMPGSPLSVRGRPTRSNSPDAAALRRGDRPSTPSRRRRSPFVVTFGTMRTLTMRIGDVRVGPVATVAERRGTGGWPPESRPATGHLVNAIDRRLVTSCAHPSDASAAAVWRAGAREGVRRRQSDAGRPRPVMLPLVTK